jgi:hypothetical protein
VRVEHHHHHIIIIIIIITTTTTTTTTTTRLEWRSEPALREKAKIRLEKTLAASCDK